MEIAGWAFLISYVVCFAVAYVLVRRLLGFRWARLTLGLICLHTALAICLLALSLTFPMAGSVVAVILFLATGFVGGRILLEKIGPSRRLARLARIYAACGWPVKG
jgi:drug/metabolite transporter (DMT)-like permease